MFFCELRKSGTVRKLTFLTYTTTLNENIPTHISHVCTVFYRCSRSTDDVEGIFAFLHGLLGPIFDEKAFHDVFPKVISEYTKKCDPDLPFYYYTGSNDRYNDGVIASFNIPSSAGEERLDRVRISRRADPGVFVANHATIPQRGQLGVRSAHFKPAGVVWMNVT